jgi:putative phosphoribosyl transferase
MNTILPNRIEAGKQLAKKLSAYANRSDVIVLGLPRGGVPVAFEIATALNVCLDICLVRKLGTPNNPELAMGAIAMGGIIAINEDLVEQEQISSETINLVITREQEELQRRDRLYRGDRPLPNLHNHIVILVDDGIATGSTMMAAISVVAQQKPKSIILAVPVAHPQILRALRSTVDRVVYLIAPASLHSISLWYEDFTQTSDREVQKLLSTATVDSLPLN